MSPNSTGGIAFFGAESAIDGPGALRLISASATTGTQLAGSNTFSGGVTLNSGILRLDSTNALGTGTFTIAGVSTIGCTTSNGVVLSPANPQVWNADFTFNDAVNAQNLTFGNGAITLGGNRTITVLSNAVTLTEPGAIGDGGSGYSLTKAGPGILALSGANTYTGSTTVSDGTLGGSGKIKGPVTVAASGTLRPGLGGTDTSALTISNTLSLAGTTVIALNRTNASTSARLVVTGVIANGGTLTVTNVGDALQGGDTFTLFTLGAVPSGNFAATNLPALDSSLNWWPTNSGADIGILVNTKPVTTNINLGAQAGVLQTLLIIGSPKHAPTDADNDPLTLAQVSAGTNGGVAAISGANVTYSNNVAGADSFNYVVTDSRGGYATNTVNVNVTNVINQQTPEIAFDGGNINLTFWGVPGTNYVIQTTTNLSYPWIDLLPEVTATNGQPIGRVSFTDTNPPGSGTGFYRLKP